MIGEFEVGERVGVLGVGHGSYTGAGPWDTISPLECQ